LQRRGFTLIELMIVLAIIAIVASIAIVNLVQARKHGNEAGGVTSLKAIHEAQTLFREADQEDDTRFDFGTLTELADYKLVDQVLGSGTKQGYLFLTSYSAASSEYLWYGVANPALPTTSGDRYFAINGRGLIHYTTLNTAPLNNTNCDIPTNMVPTR
jgi:prepilin-type N-terminal cleavage/methylation domain-containing protein